MQIFEIVIEMIPHSLDSEKIKSTNLTKKQITTSINTVAYIKYSSIQIMYTYNHK